MGESGGALVKIGLSDFVQQRNGDVAFAELKPEGTALAYEDEIAVIETIKVDISFSSPLSGKVVEVNPLMDETPEVINLDPYGEGWMVVIDPDDWQADKGRLSGAEEYFTQMLAEAQDELAK